MSNELLQVFLRQREREHLTRKHGSSTYHSQYYTRRLKTYTNDGHRWYHCPVQLVISQSYIVLSYVFNTPSQMIGAVSRQVVAPATAQDKTDGLQHASIRANLWYLRRSDYDCYQGWQKTSASEVTTIWRYTNVYIIRLVQVIVYNLQMQPCCTHWQTYMSYRPLYSLHPQSPTS